MQADGLILNNEYYPDKDDQVAGVIRQQLSPSTYITSQRRGLAYCVDK